MAGQDKKVTALTELTSVALTDLLYVIDDPSGLSVSQKVTVDTLFKTIVDLGTNNTIAKFRPTGLADSSITDDGTTVEISANTVLGGTVTTKGTIFIQTGAGGSRGVITNNTDNLFIRSESGRNLVLGSNGINSGVTLDTSGNLSVDTDTLFVDASADRVGINTSSPSEALDVNGNTKSDSFYSEKGSSSVANSATLTIKTAGASDVGLYSLYATFDDGTIGAVSAIVMVRENDFNWVENTAVQSGNISYSSSGVDLRISQTSGSTKTLNWTLTKLS